MIEGWVYLEAVERPLRWIAMRRKRPLPGTRRNRQWPLGLELAKEELEVGLAGELAAKRDGEDGCKRERGSSEE